VLWNCIHEKYEKPSKQLIDSNGFFHWVKIKDESVKQWLPMAYNYSASWNASFYPVYQICEVRLNSANMIDIIIRNEGNNAEHVFWKVLDINGKVIKKMIAFLILVKKGLLKILI